LYNQSTFFHKQQNAAQFDAAALFFALTAAGDMG
jgi:hypothetical protein